MKENSYTLGITGVNCRGKDIKVVYVLDDEDSLLDLDVSPQSEESILGQICMGRVEKLINGGAFVRISGSQRAFLNNRDGDKPVKTGELILVSVIKEAHGSKLPVVSRKLSMYGCYSIVSDFGKSVSVSKKIKEDKRLLLKQELSHICENTDFDILIRSIADTAEIDDIVSEVTQLSAILEKLIKASQGRIHVGCLYDPKLKIRHILDRARKASMNGSLRIMSDNRQMLHEIHELFTSLYPQEHVAFIYYGDTVPLNTLHRIGSRIEELLQRRVYLKHGVELVIDQVEACTIIDINYASYNKGANTNESFYNANIIAAREIFRQIRLRNLSGIILVDLINMSDESREQFMKQIRRESDDDPCKLDVIDITRLGILEMTRQRKAPNIAEIIS